MYRKTRRAVVASSLILTVFFAVPVKADMLSTIKSECAALGATQYQIVFVTSDGTTATSSNIQDYNNFVTAEAALGSSFLSDFVPAGTTWTAIASTDSTDASTNAPTYPSTPIFSTDYFSLLPLVVTNGPAIWDANPSTFFDSPMYDQWGYENSNTVWTGSTAYGTRAYGHTLGTALPEFGYSGSYPPYWLDGSYAYPSALPMPLYALSQPIPLSVTPEPSTITLFGSALLGLALVYLRRRLAKR